MIIMQINSHKKSVQITENKFSWVCLQVVLSGNDNIIIYYLHQCLFCYKSKIDET